MEALNWKIRRTGRGESQRCQAAEEVAVDEAAEAVKGVVALESEEAGAAEEEEDMEAVVKVVALPQQFMV